MAGSGRGAFAACCILEDESESVVDVVSAGELFSRFQGDPCALVFAISTLNLLVDVLLDLALEDASAGRFIEASTLEDMSGIDPIVYFAAHHMFLELRAKLVLIDGNLSRDIGDQQDNMTK